MAPNRQGRLFRRLDKGDRLQRIIDVSVELFHKKGYRSTSLDDVACELGVTKAALYHYVSSKEALLSIIYIQALENIFKNFTTISESDLPPDQKLRQILRNHIQGIIIPNLALFSVFFTEENQLPDEAHRKIQREKRKYTEITEKIIREGIELGLFKPVDPTLQAYGLIGMCNWIYTWYKPGESPYTPDQVADQFVRLLETGYAIESVNEMIRTHPTGESRGGDIADPIYRDIRQTCLNLARLIDQLEG